MYKNRKECTMQVKEPVRVLRENYYCPLKITIFECDDYGDIENEGYEYDGRYAVRYEDEISEQVKREVSRFPYVCFIRPE